MRENEVIQCPRCHEKSIAKRRNRMDGFRKTGEVLACMLCGAELQELAPAEKTEAAPATAKADALATLLNTAAESRVHLRLDEAERRFCRDCAHYLKHPFLSRCTLREEEVNPMGDCPAWSAPGTGKSS